MHFIVYHTDKSLLYDMATTSSVLMFLKMHRMSFQVINKPNAEFMSENGRLPVVVEESDDKPMCGFKDVFWFICKRLTHTPSLLELAYLDWIETNFIDAEQYICWCYETTLRDYTKSLYTHDLPWPISEFLFRRRRAEIQNRMVSKYSDFADFCAKFNLFLSQLGKFIIARGIREPGDISTDALIYGHVTAILKTQLHPKLVEAIKWHKRVENLAHLVETDNGPVETA